MSKVGMDKNTTDGQQPMSADWPAGTQSSPSKMESVQTYWKVRVSQELLPAH